MVVDGDRLLLVGFRVQDAQYSVVERKRHVHVGHEDSAPLQLGNVVMGECSPQEPSAPARHALQPERPLVLGMPDQMYFKNVLRVQFAGTQGLFRFSAAAPADQWMIEKLLELRGCRAQVVHIQDFGNPFLPAIRAFSADDQVGRREPQNNSGLKEIGLGGILQDIELFLGQVPL